MHPLRAVGAIDCHSHLLPSSFVGSLFSLEGADPSIAAAVTRIRGGFLERFSVDEKGLHERIRVMDESGIDVQVLSPGSPFTYPTDPALREDLCVSWNEGATAVAEEHPGRFRVFGSVPLPSIDGAIAETDRLLDLPTTAGISIRTHIEGVPLDDQRWDPVFNHWDDREVTVFLHPDGFCVKGLLDDYAMNWDIGTQFDDTIAVVRLYNGLVLRYPGIRWIVPHLGGCFPFVLGRLDHHWERDRHLRRLPSRPSESLQGIWFDTAGHGPEAIRFALDALGPEKILFGSDYPMIWSDGRQPFIEATLQACSEAEKGLVLRKNVERLIGVLSN